MENVEKKSNWIFYFFNKPPCFFMLRSNRIFLHPPSVVRFEIGSYQTTIPRTRYSRAIRHLPYWCGSSAIGAYNAEASHGAVVQSCGGSGHVMGRGIPNSPCKARWWYQIFWNVHPDPWGNGIQFDLRIFFKWVGSTANDRWSFGRPFKGVTGMSTNGYNAGWIRHVNRWNFNQLTE